MIDSSMTALKPLEMANQNDSGSSKNGFMSIQNRSIFESGLQSSSVITSLLPALELVGDASNLTRPRANNDVSGSRTASDAVSRRTSSDATRIGDRFGLNPEQRQIAERIESSILSEDLDALQKTMSQFAHRGSELAPILAKVRFDLATDRSINVRYTCDRPGDQCLFSISKGGVAVHLSTDRREPPVSTGLNRQGPGTEEYARAQLALKRIARD